MSKKYIIALDQGTTSSRAIIFDGNGSVKASAQHEFEQIYPQPGWVEHDPMQIWSSQSAVLTGVLAKSAVALEEVAGIGITNQRETTVVWDRFTGVPICNAIVWQCRRTAAICDEMRSRAGLEEYIKHNTGLVLDAYFSGAKVKWILDNIEGARARAEKGDLLFGTVDSWLVWKLTNGRVHITDYTNASRTMLFNIRTLKWDERLLAEFDIPACMLPAVRNSSEIYGETTLNGVAVPIAGIAGDQQSALFGQGCFSPGEGKNTYGTGCFLLMNTGEKFVESKNGLLTTVGIGINHRVEYALEGSVFTAGAVVQWLRDGLRLISTSAESESCALKVEDTHGVYFVPAFTGLGSPWWDMYARGTITGLTRGADKNHIVRAALESIAYQSYDVLRAMRQDSGIELSALKVDGGASMNNFLMQFQADIIGVDVLRSAIVETTALGAAFLAGLAVGFWKSRAELRDILKLEQHFVSAMNDAERSEKLAGWHRAVGMASPGTVKVYGV